MRHLILSIVSSFALAACGGGGEVPTTSDYDTANLGFFCSAMSNGQEALVDARLYSGNSGVAFAEGDVLFASADGEPSVELSPYGPYGYGSAALIPSTDTTIAISFRRDGSEEASVEVPLPEPFVLTVPQGPLSLSDSIVITWSPSGTGDLVTVGAAGPCILPFSRDLAADTGTYTLQQGDLSFQSSSCSIAVSVKKSVANTPLSPKGFREASASVAQVRTAAMEVGP